MLYGFLIWYYMLFVSIWFILVNVNLLTIMLRFTSEVIFSSFLFILSWFVNEFGDIRYFIL